MKIKSLTASSPLRSALAISMLCTSAFCVTPGAHAADFSGGRIEMTIPFKEGGGTDTWGRFFAPLIARNLPGNPVIIVKNIPGGGSTSGANQFQQRAKDDGTDLFGSSGSTLFPYLLGDPRVHYDYKSWVGILSSPTDAVVYVNPELGVKTAADLVKLKGRELKFASQGATSLDLVSLLAFQQLGLDVKAVFGMKGRGSARLAFERGEVNLDVQTTSAYLQKVQPLVDEGKAIPLFTWGVLGKDGKIKRDPTFPNLPNFVEVYEMLNGKAPSSATYRAWKTFFVAGYAAQKGLYLPKSTPADVIQAYRKAAAKAIYSPDFKAKSESLLGDYEQTVGEQDLKMFADALNIDSDAKHWVIHWLNTKYNANLPNDK